MKKYAYLMFLLIVVIGSFLAGFWYNRSQTPKSADAEAHRTTMEAVYAEEKPAEQASDDIVSMSPGTVKISLEQQQVIGVKVATAEKTSWSDNRRVLGRVVPDETRIYRINAATDGWVKKMLPVTTGSLVKKDDLLAAFYAPEFFSAMRAFLYGLRSLERFEKSGTETKEQIESTDASIENYRNGLRNLGMTDHQLDEIVRTRQGGDQVEIRAPAAGFVLTRNITFGERFQRGTELYRIVDLSHVWVVADIFENESWFFRPGMLVKVTHQAQNKTFRARVSSVLPQFDSVSRTLKVRVEVENPGYALRPDMFVDVNIPVALPPALTVPADAILDSGLRKTVFVDRGNGFFEPRQVETGASLGGRIEIIKGLKPGERIVVSGNFLIDSESKMEMMAAGMSPGAERQEGGQQSTKDQEGHLDKSTKLPSSDALVSGGAHAR